MFLSSRRLMSALFALTAGTVLSVHAGETGGAVGQEAPQPILEKADVMALETAVQKAEAWFNAQTTLRADFAQVAQGRTQTGVFYLKRPSEFLWSYQMPTKQKIVSTKAYTFFHNEETGQTTQIPSSTPLVKLLNQSSITLRSDDLKPLSAKQTAKAYQLKVALLDEGDEQGFLTLGFQKKPHRLSKIIIEDVLGQQTVLYLSNMRQNIHLNDKLFKFTPPQYQEN